jgi:glycosyltransferase involved in cell wall biosynthesis
VARVAVVIPCYQSARFLRETVESVTAQSLPEWSLVVVDDGSADDPRATIADLLERDPRLHFVTQANHGVARARNQGVEVAGPADHYLFLDADDVLEPTMLERLVARLDRHPEAAGAYCAVSFIDEAGAPLPVGGWGERLRPTRFGVGTIPDEVAITPFEAIYCLAGVVPSVMLMRAESFKRTPGWDESFGQGFEDTMMFLHLALQGELHHVPAPLVRHRRYEGQSSADHQRHAAQVVRLYKWWEDPPGLGAADLAVVRRAQRFRERRVIPRRALSAARRLLAEGRVAEAARHIGGAARIAIRSHVGRRDAGRFLGR